MPLSQEEIERLMMSRVAIESAPLPLFGQSLPLQADPTPFRDETADAFFRALGSRPGRSSQEVFEEEQRRARVRAQAVLAEEREAQERRFRENYRMQIAQGIAQGIDTGRSLAIDGDALPFGTESPAPVLPDWMLEHLRRRQK